jgi:GNAT superfamily N-acetyltransferase
VSAYRIERGAAVHVAPLPGIEATAGSRFREIGMGEVADGGTTPLSILHERVEAGQLYVAVDEDAAPAGFLMWSPKDGLAYIEEVSVHPAHAGHRLAASMIDRLGADARGHFPALTLSTFRAVPWNAPYYASLGFREMPYADAGPDHLKNWRHQQSAGLDMSKRLFMIRHL